jgi:phosphoglycerate kinase
MDDVDFKGKVTLVRVDLNSAIDPETNKILDDTRIRVHGETTIKELSDKQAKTVVLAHQGRPGSKDFISLEEHSKILGRT